MISVLIADDQDLVREGLRMMLEAEPDLASRARPGPGSRPWPRPGGWIPMSS